MTTPKPNIDHLLPAPVNPFVPAGPEIEFLENSVVEAELVPSDARGQEDGILYIN
jgi:hypothetical protein